MLNRFLLASAFIISFFSLAPLPAMATCITDCITVNSNCLGDAAAFSGSFRDDAMAACAANFESCKAVCNAPSAVDTSSGSASTGAVVTLTNPLGTTDPRVIIGNLIKALLSIIGSVTLLMFIYGGVLWITSMGNDKTVAKGKAVLVWTVIGLAIIAGAYVLTNAVITGLTTGSVIGT